MNKIAYSTHASTCLLKQNFQFLLHWQQLITIGFIKWIATGFSWNQLIFIISKRKKRRYIIRVLQPPAPAQARRPRRRVWVSGYRDAPRTLRSAPAQQWFTSAVATSFAHNINATTLLHIAMITTVFFLFQYNKSIYCLISCWTKQLQLITVIKYIQCSNTEQHP